MTQATLDNTGGGGSLANKEAASAWKGHAPVIARTRGNKRLGNDCKDAVEYRAEQVSSPASRFFVGRFCHDLKLPGAIHRMDADGTLSWRRPDVLIWFTKCSADAYQTPQDIEAALARRELFEVTP